jgi:hypothetical protein
VAAAKLWNDVMADVIAEGQKEGTLRRRGSLTNVSAKSKKKKLIILKSAS